MFNRFSLVSFSALFLTAACGGVEEAHDGAEAEAGAEDALVIGPIVVNKLVYSIQSGAIHVRNANTGTDVVLPVSGRYPSMSPDRTKIVYVASGGRIAVVDADGTNNDFLTGNGYTMPAWSPDSSQITFASSGTAGWSADIFLINADGTGFSQLTDNTNEWFFAPRFLSDTLIVFQRGFTGSASFPIVGTSASMQTAFFGLSGVSGAGNIDVSPNGSQIVYTKVNGSCGNSAIAIADITYGGFFGLPSASNETELYCNGNAHRDAEHPSFGALGTVGFKRGNGTGISYAGRDLMTIHRSGSSLKFHVDTTSAVDMTVR
jgi:hypothetical protein